MTEEHRFKMKIGETLCAVTAVRRDRPWGHGLKIGISTPDGQLLNSLSFACHAEFPDFELFQAKSTAELLAIVRDRLSDSEMPSILLNARALNIQLIFRMNGPLSAPTSNSAREA